MALDAMKQEWLRFKHDRPGERFENHRRRMSNAPHRSARGVVGVGLVLLGIVMLFLPGPGMPAIALGLAILAGMWPWLARRMDDGEPHVREWSRGLNHSWKQLSRRLRVVIATATGVFLGLVAIVVYRAM